MGMVQCTGCGKEVDEFTTFFADTGQVCGPCNARLEAASSAEFAAGADNDMHSHGGMGGGGPIGSFSSSSTTTSVGPDGQTRTVTTTSTVNAGLLGVFIKLIMGLFRR